MEYKIISYNSTGLSVYTAQFIRNLLDQEKPDILLLQETFLMESTLHKISGIHPLYLVHTVCGTDETEKSFQVDRRVAWLSCGRNHWLNA
jgi:exonuclease III